MTTHSKTVLLITEIDANALAVESCLCQDVSDAYQLVRATSLDAARQVLCHRHPDLIILDLGVSQLTGSIPMLALLGALPATERLPPLIVLTNTDDAGTACPGNGGVLLCAKNTMMTAPTVFAQLVRESLRDREQQYALLQSVEAPCTSCAHFVPCPSLPLASRDSIHGHRPDSFYTRTESGGENAGNRRQSGA